MKDMMKDIDFSARVLRRNPGFSITVLLALALGIGTTSAIFRCRERRSAAALAVQPA